jgi:hypothetical protein
MTQTEALRLALEALERYVNEDEIIEGMQGNEPWVETKRMGEKAITAIKAALEAKDEPEYYGLTKDHLWMSISKEHYDRLKPEFRMACYTTPPQRKPLTEGEIGAILEDINAFGTRLYTFARAVEAAHGIKGKA